MNADELALAMCSELDIPPQSPTPFKQGEAAMQTYKYFAFMLRTYALMALHDTKVAADAAKK